MIHPSAIIHPRAQIGAGCEIGPYCVIGEHVTIGDQCRLHSHVVIDGEASFLFEFFSVRLAVLSFGLKHSAPGLFGIQSDARHLF